MPWGARDLERLPRHFTVASFDDEQSSGAPRPHFVRFTWLPQLAVLQSAGTLSVAAVLCWVAFFARSPPWPWLFELVGRLVLAAVGYASVGGVVNRASVIIDPHALRMRDGPLPWSRPRDLPLDGIATTRVVDYGNEERLYAVCVVAGSKEHRAFSGFATSNDAEGVANILNLALDELKRLYVTA